MSVDDPHLPDDWITSWTYFRETLSILALDVEEQIKAVGGPHVAWELRQDAVDFSEAILKTANGRVSEDVERGITELVKLLKEAPKASYEGDAIPALSHPQWAAIRALAKSLLARIQ
jgi:hypothetical protein